MSDGPIEHVTKEHVTPEDGQHRVQTIEYKPPLRQPAKKVKMGRYDDKIPCELL